MTLMNAPVHYSDLQLLVECTKLDMINRREPACPIDDEPCSILYLALWIVKD